MDSGGSDVPGRSPEARPAPGSALGARVLAATAATAGGMIIYELLKEAILPGLSKWESHSLTIAVTATLGAVAAAYVGRKQEQQTERSLRNEENLRITLESIGDAVIATDRNGRITRVNPVAARLTGHDEGEALGRAIEDVLVLAGGDPNEPPENPVRRVLRTGKVEGLPSQATLVRKDGAKFSIADSGAPIRDRNGVIVGVVIVFRDVTNEQRLRLQASQVDKLDALGMLAGGIAHDFNNALAGILASAELVRLDVERSNPSLVPQLDVIVETTKRARDLTGRLLAFARQQALTSEPVDVHTAVRDAIALLERSVDKRIRIERDLAAATSTVRADAAQLSSIFLNLGINAVHAMPEGGILAFASKVVELDAAYCRASPFDLAAGSHLEIQVRDTGHGITTEDLPKIFDPFFTTKDQGRGTGLGLAMVYGSMKQYRGAVTAYSEPGKGTLFRLLFPLEGAPRPDNTKASIVGGSGRILLVEDEGAIRGVAKQFLARIGYVVTVAENGAVGLAAYREAAGAFDLVILDMVMPEMNGAECFRELKKLDPAVKVLLCSGFAGGADVEALKAEGAVGFIAKPYELAELSKAVARAIRD